MTGSEAGDSRRSTTGRVILGSLVGTSLEWYDFFLYGTASALVFNKLFFPTFDPLTGTLLAFVTYAVGFLSRPLGGVVFGHLGDRVGRKRVLVATLLVMGTGTVLIGALPTYAMVGVTAPILLVIIRFVQGIGLGGEWGGAVLMSLEHGRADRRGRNGSWPQVGVPVGNLLSAAVLGVLSAALPATTFLVWGWRIAFLLSGALVLIGLWVRRSLTESPLFTEVRQEGARARMPVVEVLRRHPRGLLVAIGARIGTDVAYYTFTLFILTYVTTDLHLPSSVGLTSVLIGSAAQLFLIPLFGALSDRYGRRRVYAAGAIGAGVWVFAFFPLLDTRVPGIIVLATVIALLTHAAMFGPQASFIAELFATELRYSGASIGYQLAGIAGGGIAPIVSIALVKTFGSALVVAVYVLLMAMLTLIALAAAPTSPVPDPAPADAVPAPSRP